MEKYKKSFRELLTDVTYIIPVIIIALLSFGFVLTHESINIDTLSADRYYEGGELIAQGRIGAVLIHSVFNIMEFNPFFVDCIAVIFLILSAMIFCILFKEIAKNKIHPVAYLIFSGFFISYPLIHEIFVYTPASLSIGIGFFLIGISCISVYELLQCQKVRYAIIAGLCIFLAIGLYESFAPVFLCGMLITLILQGIYQKDEIKILDLIKKAMVYIVILIFAIELTVIIPKVCQKIGGIEPSTRAAKSIYYQTLGITGGLANLKNTVLAKYGIAAVYYLPITILVIAMLICLLFLVKSLFQKKKRWLSLCFLGLMVCTVILSIIQGTASPYRTCQVFPLFIAFIFLLLANCILAMQKVKWIKYAFLFILFTMIFFQTKELHKWFYLNVRRYDYEKNVAIAVGQELQKSYDLNKPVIFMVSQDIPADIKEKTYVQNNTWQAELVKALAKVWNISYKDLGDDRYWLKINETNVASYLAWGIAAFGEPNTEILKFFHYLGYDLKRGNIKMYLEATEAIKNMPVFPTEGSIIEKEDYIIVHL